MVNSLQPCIMTLYSDYSLVVVKQEDKLEMLFKHFLVEDKSLERGASYVDSLVTCTRRFDSC